MRTPGRWVYDCPGTDGGHIESTDGRFLLADSGDWGGLILSEDGVMMAAGPQLAEALEACRNVLEGFKPVSGRDLVLEAAIAVATEALRVSGWIR